MFFSINILYFCSVEYLSVMSCFRIQMLYKVNKISVTHKAMQHKICGGIKNKSTALR